ncbi:MAG TPA: TetR/AcrR family transcriptional regulator [Terriglobales bacterium]|nr:TetR/AcrR family transcriptional regulator [Terriglobales bacterium]
MPATAPRFSAQDRRQQIMQVAMELFARQGFKGTTTRQIADQAGVNEAIVFRHFPCKDDLYWSVIESKCHLGERRRWLEHELQQGGEDRHLLTGIAEEILQRNWADPGMSRLLFFSALENHRLSHRFFRTYVAERYEALARFIRGRIRAGVFRRVDPLLAARGFLGMVVYHFLIQELFGGKRYQKFDPREVSATLTDIWLEGMLTRGPRRRLHGKARRNGASRTPLQFPSAPSSRKGR